MSQGLCPHTVCRLLTQTSGQAVAVILFLHPCTYACALSCIPP